MPKLKNAPEKVKLADGTEIEVIRTDGAGKIPYLDDSGAEKSGDLISLLTTLKSTLDEKGALETKAKDAETKLGTYSTLGDPAEIVKSLEMVKNLKAGDLKTIEDTRKLQEEAALRERGQWEQKLKDAETVAAKLKGEISDAALLNLCNEVAGKKRKLADGKEVPIFAAPGSGIKQVFRDHCRQREDGKWEFSRVPGDFSSSNIILHEFQPAPPEVAFQELAKGNDWLLYKVPGSGSGIGNDGGGGGQPGTLSRKAYLDLHQRSPDEARKFTSSGGKVVDDAAA